MAKKNKLPNWLPLSLLLLLVVLVLAVIVSQPEQQPTRVPQPFVSQHQAQPVAPPPAAAPAVTFEDFHSVPETPPSVEPLPAPTPLPPLPQVKAGIALIIDDVGYDLAALQRILKLPITVAIAILPDSPHAKQAAEMAHQAGQMVMLHLPMEPDTPKYRDEMTDAFLRVGMDDATLRSTFLHDLERVPYVQGVNNHMGSHLTRLEEPMRTVMQVCREKGLFFVDSRTSADSVAAKMAANAGISWASRQIFLDNQLDTTSLRKSWDKALACAKRGGTCVVIAHPHPETVNFLEQQLGADDWKKMQPLSAMLRAPVVKGAS
ncbi:MAG TPA: divergent polysaccharide deacetylase family protein [Mariprofundaceae bacterium]|nr:divergent polysaccharide deacetylase family protein [Mariprofundaceae bacterium]